MCLLRSSQGIVLRRYHVRMLSLHTEGGLARQKAVASVPRLPACLQSALNWGLRTYKNRWRPLVRRRYPGSPLHSNTFWTPRLSRRSKRLAFTKNAMCVEHNCVFERSLSVKGRPCDTYSAVHGPTGKTSTIPVSGGRVVAGLVGRHSGVACGSPRGAQAHNWHRRHQPRQRFLIGGS